MRVEKVTKLACDFCGKDQDEVEKLIAGPRHVAICNECVTLCVEIIDEEKTEPADAPESAPAHMEGA